MDEDGSMDIDPAIAAAMGFSGFGTQPGKKRKFDANDAFVDPETVEASKSAKGQLHANGANNIPLGERKPVNSAAEQDARATSHEQQQQQGASGGVDGNWNYSMEALRQGVRNGRGDMVYFMPSFIADPWKDLKPQ